MKSTFPALYCKTQKKFSILTSQSQRGQTQVVGYACLAMLQILLLLIYQKIGHSPVPLVYTFLNMFPLAISPEVICSGGNSMWHNLQLDRQHCTVLLLALDCFTLHTQQPNRQDHTILFCTIFQNLLQFQCMACLLLGLLQKHAGHTTNSLARMENIESRCP